MTVKSTTTRAAWLALAGAVVMSACPAPARGGEETPLPLKLEMGVKALTTAQVAGTYRMMAFGSATGKVNLGFGEVLVTVSPAGKGHVLEIDVDGDGKISRSEQVPIVNGTGVLTFIRPGDDTQTTYRVRFTQVGVGVDRGTIRSVSARCQADYAWRTTVGKTVVRLIDANLDGKITQDGSDAVAIGASTIAMPLLKRHCIDGKEYDLEVSADGKTLSAVAHNDREHGKVSLSFRAGALKSLILQSATGAYDVAANPMIPPGDYRLTLGMLVQGGETAYIVPPSTPVTYTVKADFVNVLRLGPPLTVGIAGSYDKKGNISIRPPGGIVGAGGEYYRIQYPVAGRPMVAILAGGRSVASGPMACDKDNRPTGFSERCPGLSDTWQVQVQVPVPGMPAASGARSVGMLPIPDKPGDPPDVPPATVRYLPLKDRPASRPATHPASRPAP
ncbi:MAG: hypothetical protein NTV86_23940 [Planctomycetota bacterium]|nr:hypothetical protein [Planctomycetota bacterium]